MNAPVDLPKFLTIADMIAAFPLVDGKPSVGERTIQRWAKAKKIPGAMRIGRRWFFQRIPVTRWIEGGGITGLVGGVKAVA